MLYFFRPRFGQKKNYKLVVDAAKLPAHKSHVSFAMSKWHRICLNFPICLYKFKHIYILFTVIFQILRESCFFCFQKGQEEMTSSQKCSKMFDGTVAGNVKVSRSSNATPNTMTSSQLMSKMRARNQICLGDGEREIANSGVPVEQDPDQMELITDIRNHIAFCCIVDGQAGTTELIDAFRTRIPPSESAKFKAMLKQLCTFRTIEGVGTWRLRPQFR